MLKGLIHRSFRLFGLDIVRASTPGETVPPDFQADEIEVIRQIQPWTMTSLERIYALIHAVRYVSKNLVGGAIVECGVWKGGSMAAVARTLLQIGDTTRDLYLFDTYTGMSAPSANDSDYEGNLASDVLRRDAAFWCSDAPLSQVREVLYSTGYPKEKIHFVQGRVEETIPSQAPETISLLRFDTDWYESTKHELVQLFPRLKRGGVIIVDDYGHWAGARQACDEYFAENRTPILLNRIDYTGRIGLKL